MIMRLSDSRNAERAGGAPLPAAVVGRATTPFILAWACAMKNAKGRQIIAAPVVIAVAIIALLMWWLVA